MKDLLNSLKVVYLPAVAVSSDGSSAASDAVSFNGYDGVLAVCSFDTADASTATWKFAIQVATDSVVPSDGTFAAFSTDVTTSDLTVGASTGVDFAAIYCDLKLHGVDTGCLKVVYGCNTSTTGVARCILIFHRGTGGLGPRLNAPSGGGAMQETYRFPN